MSDIEVVQVTSHDGWHRYTIECPVHRHETSPEGQVTRVHAEILADVWHHGGNEATRRRAYAMAAAEDMLEALKEASETLEGVYGGPTTIAEVRLCLTKVDAAIAKAEGK